MVKFRSNGRKKKYIKRPHQRGLARQHSLVLTIPSDYSTSSLWLRNHVSKLVELLSQYAKPGKFIIGCVAWVTHQNIFDALSSARAAGAIVQIIVNKERHLHSSQNENDLRSRCDAVTPDLTQGELLLMKGNCKSNRKQACFRCIGTANGGLHTPRMHHKFVVLGTFDSVALKPVTALVGSFNWTNNASHSLESVLKVSETSDLEALLAEFQQISIRSEPLQYTSRTPKHDVIRKVPI
jgi:phosphatidylserine/phosphatidylglycerophosphate/cardiolipin synthase-like enzyme